MDQHSFDQHNFSQHSLKQHSFIEEIQGNESGIFEKYIGQAKIVQLLSGSERPLVTIGAKAFLSCKSIEKLILPDTLERVADWGFAHMKNLREITLPAREILFGKKVFLGCENLQKVYLIHSERENKLCGSVKQSTVDSLYEGLPYFLASMFRFFPENRLENLEMAGDEQGQWEWLTAYDEALQAYVQRPHDYDFEPAFIGWFDIEDVDDQKQNFIVQQRKPFAMRPFRPARLCPPPALPPRILTCGPALPRESFCY